MPIAFNFKICDNAAECSGIPACPVQAISWDSTRQTLVVDNEKCISCSLCVKACPVEGAILVAKDYKELAELREQIENDTRSRTDLLEDRYGAPVTDASLFLNESNFDEEILNTKRVALVEFWNNESIKCRVKSPKYSEIVPRTVAVSAVAHGEQCLRFKIRKVNADDSKELAKRYNITKLPTMLIFYNGKVIHRIDGFVPTSQKEKLRLEIQNAVKTLK